VEYTLTGLDENQPYYRLFIDGVQQGGWLNIGLGGTYTFNTTLSSPHQMEISIPEPASGLLLALAGAIAFRRRK
jgi:MprA protease rhombosortase-interaction domain-containing protein